MLKPKRKSTSVLPAGSAPSDSKDWKKVKEFLKKLNKNSFGCFAIAIVIALVICWTVKLIFGGFEFSSNPESNFWIITGIKFLAVMLVLFIAASVSEKSSNWSRGVPWAVLLIFLLLIAKFYGGEQRQAVVEAENAYTEVSGQAGDVRELFIPWSEYNFNGPTGSDYEIIAKGDTLKYSESYVSPKPAPRGPLHLKVRFLVSGKVIFRPV